MHEELVDRFGLLPEPAQALLDSHRLRILGKPLGVVRLDATSETIQLQFEDQPAVDAGRIIQLIQRNRHWKLAGPNKLRVAMVSANVRERVTAARKVLEALRGPSA
jgi:transcription-repair coupling factor (superfamily II helicase)